ncbi:HNH endonuclease signature motif containing protein [Mycobacteroides chelonae]|uniref:HNH endonuclease signature motif containing protein n=1 Tax=Mycobacteroides chelonae TaxID=1774 RepID=UPI003AAC0EA6
MSLVVPPEVARRAFENWTCAPNGCHISTYSVQSRGYAQIGWLGGDRKQHGTTAHRAAWVHLNGQVPEGMEVDHTYVCDRRCVNVDHLRLLTSAQNKQHQGRAFPLGFCTRGHPDSERKLTGSGMECAICRREWNRESARRRKKRAAL